MLLLRRTPGARRLLADPHRAHRTRREPAADCRSRGARGDRFLPAPRRAARSGLRHCFALGDRVPPLFVQETAFAVQVEGEPRLSDEHDEHRWCTPDEALALLPFAGLRRAVRLALAKGRAGLTDDHPDAQRGTGRAGAHAATMAAAMSNWINFSILWMLTGSPVAGSVDPPRRLRDAGLVHVRLPPRRRPDDRGFPPRAAPAPVAAPQSARPQGPRRSGRDPPLAAQVRARDRGGEADRRRAPRTT